MGTTHELFAAIADLIEIRSDGMEAQWYDGNISLRVRYENMRVIIAMARPQTGVADDIRGTIRAGHDHGKSWTNYGVAELRRVSAEYREVAKAIDRGIRVRAGARARHVYGDTMVRHWKRWACRLLYSASTRRKIR